MKTRSTLRQLSSYQDGRILPLPNQLQPVLKKYKLIHTYPKGSYLFHTATEPMKTLPMPPITWDVDAYLANSTVEERETQSANDSMITANIKSMLSSMQGKAHTPKNYKPHQLRFEVSKEYISRVLREIR